MSVARSRVFLAAVVKCGLIPLLVLIACLVRPTAYVVGQGTCDYQVPLVNGDFEADNVPPSSGLNAIPAGWQGQMPVTVNGPNGGWNSVYVGLINMGPIEPEIGSIWQDLDDPLLRGTLVTISMNLYQSMSVSVGTQSQTVVGGASTFEFRSVTFFVSETESLPIRLMFQPASLGASLDNVIVETIECSTATAAASTATYQAEATQTIEAAATQTVDAAATQTADIDNTATSAAGATQTVDAGATQTVDAQATGTADAAATQTVDAEATSTSEAAATQTEVAEATSTTEAGATQTVDAEATSTTEAGATQTADAETTGTADAAATQTADANATSTTEAAASQTSESIALTATVDQELAETAAANATATSQALSTEEAASHLTETAVSVQTEQAAVQQTESAWAAETETAAIQQTEFALATETAIAAIPTATSAPDTTSVHITLTNTAGDSIPDGVQVCLDEVCRNSDDEFGADEAANGTIVVFEDVEPGSHTVQVLHNGTVLIQQPVSALAGVPLELALQVSISDDDATPIEPTVVPSAVPPVVVLPSTGGAAANGGYAISMLLASVMLVALAVLVGRRRTS